MAIGTRKRRARKRLGTMPAGSERAIQIVEAFISQEERVRARRGEVAEAMERLQREPRRRPL